MFVATPLLLAACLVSPPSGDAVIRAAVGKSEIVITTTARLAGAVHSLTWDGVEFIDSADHGRQLQSAAAFDCGKPGFHAECFNPTEAGARADGAGDKSTSRLLALRAEKGVLDTTTRMAFWLSPGEKSDGKPALNATRLSAHTVRKRVTLGGGGDPHVIEYAVTFTVPKGERHTLAQFEAVTGYMPPAFAAFETFDPATGELAPLGDGPGEQPKPVVFSTKSGGHAMGVLAAGPTPAGQSGPGYGRWRFEAERVVKWNAVYRVRDPAGVPAGEYGYRLFVVVGTREGVRASMTRLAKPAAGKE